MTVITYEQALVAQTEAHVEVQRAENWDEKKRAMKRFQSATLRVSSTYAQRSAEIETLVKQGNSKARISELLNLPLSFVAKIIGAKPTIDSPGTPID